MIYFCLPSKGWDALLDGKFFDGIQSVVEKTHDALLHFNYFLGLNISDTPWYIIKSNFTDKPDKWLLFVILALLIPAPGYKLQLPDGKPDEDDESHDATYVIIFLLHSSCRSWYLLDLLCTCKRYPAVLRKQTYRES